MNRPEAVRVPGDLRAARAALAAGLVCGLGYLFVIFFFPALHTGRFPLPWAVPIFEGPFAVASLAAGYLCFQRHRLREDLESAALGVGLWVAAVFIVAHVLAQPDYGLKPVLPPTVAPAFFLLAYATLFGSLGVAARSGGRHFPLTDRSRLLLGIGAFAAAAGIVLSLVLAAPALPPLMKSGRLTPFGLWFGGVAASGIGVWSLWGGLKRAWHGDGLPFSAFLALACLLFLAAVSGFLLAPFRYGLTWYVAGFARPTGILILFLGLLHEQIGLYRDARRRQRVLEALHRAGQAMMATLDQRQLLDVITQGVMDVSNAEGAILFGMDRDSAALRPISWSGRFVPFVHEGIRLPVGIGVAGGAVREGRPFWSSDVSADPRTSVNAELNGLISEKGYKAVLAAPIRVKGEVFGALVVTYWRAREFKDEDIQVLSAFAAQAAAALENSRLYDEVKSQLTTLERVQAQLVQVEKLSAIGQFVAGVTHELNNPLTVVLVGAELLLQQDIPPALREELAEIRDAARRTARIVEGLSAFARQQPPAREATDIHNVVAQALRLRASQLALDNIRVVEDLDGSVPLVSVDSHQIVQVLVNLISNAHQAIRGVRDSGTITVRTFHGEEGIEIEIEDDGPGIPPTVLSRIFDPFFTTKPVGQGTGLGLSISHGIVREHGGIISARNGPRGGAVFRVTLPLDSPPPTRSGFFAQEPRGNAGAGPESEPIKSAASEERSCRVLIVDDDAHVANTLAKIVAGLGHWVDRAHSAEEARRKLAVNHYDALLLDLTMRTVDGRTLWVEIKETHPGLERSVVFLTGGAADAETAAFLAQTGLPCLAKPLSPQEIPSALSAVLPRR